MAQRTCPYCKERIRKGAVVCRYCRRDLPDPPSPSVRWPYLVLSVMGVLAAVAVLSLGTGYYQERLRWTEEEGGWEEPPGT
ncbi:hypothetical protein G3N55_04680 [Dissulfurirhabdus thermomarina]|uniref:Zinc ribbon domain-containing protein n=1 Tax=Dissulfurirhabdus thermomarina TaxID=1765737 RepID=A0A6N9TNY0_DISTH|nr:hypothetical protein [Dissulfurirhabdus thermomarina]NDY42140.1 hypothetical protein [Dissulfurirhabdus thermomarina]NMX23074.1 hypothetical protein [Dissulfurirhabdus thermomarina]